jgi:predicted dehydrogenase
MKTTAAATIAAAATNAFIARSAYASSDETVKIALIGCGGRGSGACSQALSTSKGPVKLISMADAFEDRLNKSLEEMKVKHPELVDVKADKKFVGFDAYKQAIDSGADMVIIATPPGFRPIHFEYAVKQGRHIFAEKPVATDAAGIRRFLAAVEEAKKKNLKVGIGLQRHHQAKYIDTIQRIHDGALGDIRLLRTYWNGTSPWVRNRMPGQTEMEYQMRNWYYFVWLCGDHIVEQHIHNLDVANWIMKGHPVQAQGVGGRQVRTGPEFGEIYDHHMLEYTYADGTKLLSECRHQSNTWQSVTEYAHGTKAFSDVSGGMITDPAGNEIWKHKAVIDPRAAADNSGRSKKRGFEPDPYQVEHDDLQEAIRKNLPYNEGEYGAHSTFTAILGRMCTYSGNVIKWDDAINAKVSVMPEKYDWNATPPSVPDKDGRYSIAMPGMSNNDTVWGRVNKEIMGWARKR